VRAIDVLFRVMNVLSQLTNIGAYVVEVTHVFGLPTEQMMADCDKRRLADLNS
jgi:hypothetical protein